MARSTRSADQAWREAEAVLIAARNLTNTVSAGVVARARREVARGLGLGGSRPGVRPDRLVELVDALNAYYGESR